MTEDEVLLALAGGGCSDPCSATDRYCSCRNNGHVAQGRMLRYFGLTPSDLAALADGRAKVVPVEPTEEMLRVARQAAFFYPVDYAHHYRAMLAAAPQAEPTKTEENKERQ